MSFTLDQEEVLKRIADERLAIEAEITERNIEVDEAARAANIAAGIITDETATDVAA